MTTFPPQFAFVPCRNARGRGTTGCTEPIASNGLAGFFIAIAAGCGA